MVLLLDFCTYKELAKIHKKHGLRAAKETVLKSKDLPKIQVRPLNTYKTKGRLFSEILVTLEKGK